MHRTLALATLASALLACGCASSTTEPLVDADFRLTSVNGAALPFTLSTAADARTEITGGVLHLRADGTFADSVWVLRTQGPGAGAGTAQTYVVAAGRWERAGSSVRLMPADGEDYSLVARSDGTLLRDPNEGIALTYAPD